MTDKDKVQKETIQRRKNLIKKLQDKFPQSIIQEQPYNISYIHSFAEDSLFFKEIRNGKLMGSKCTKCGYTHGTPRSYCIECGEKTEWVELPLEGKIHSFTVCNFGGEEFLSECPYILILVEFEGVNTLFLNRLVSNEWKSLEKKLLNMGDEDANKFLIGRKIKAQFKKKEDCQCKPTDVYFVLAD